MKKYFWMALALLLTCFFLSACELEVEEKDREKEESGYYVYYLDSGETQLEKEAYRPEKENVSFMLKDLTGRLGKVPEEGGKHSLLPEGVAVNSYELEKDVLILNFNRAYGEMSRAREILARAGIVKTFVQLPEVSAVRMTVRGKALLDSRNQEVGDMTADTFAEFSGSDMDAYRYDTFTLYFTDKTGEHLVEEKRNVYYKRTLPRERVALEQLAKGPMVKGNYPVIPDDTLALSITISDRICYVNMERGFQENALGVSEEVQVYSVVNSLLAACEADKVQISVEGNTSGNFREEMPLYSFYEKNEDLVVVVPDS